MNKSFMIILGVALAATAFAYFKSPELAWRGVRSGSKLFVDILPALLAGFLLGGMVQVLLPHEWIARWAGEDSGFTGLLLATGLGAITPGGPFLQFPLVASLWKSGAGVGPVTAYLISWTLLGINKMLIWEIPMLGWRYTLAKSLACIAAPLVLGYAAAWFYRQLGPYFQP